ncbi:hypothetical protein EU528_14470 [Candidatus Thorarchaeota archaeon]|nr:MAG: hypothetical protein EU528_14470 [Candidatus Thorarchaeota archaeon]
MMKQAREDTQCAMKVWADLLPELIGSRLESAYTKGSANKTWDSHIDYVPTISDIDIHITLKDDKSLFGSYAEDFEKAVEMSQICEEEFIRRRPDHLHIPRMQVMETHFLKQNERYTPPRLQDITVLYGEPKIPKRMPKKDTVRAGDIENIIELKEYLSDLPRRIMDRTGLDWWAIIRVMCWRVSPSPVRIITQTHTDPLDVWSWNRTKIHGALLERGYEKLAKHYHGFYDAGWRLFLSGFTDLKAFRETAVQGYYVLYDSYWAVDELISDVNTSRLEL